MSWMWLRFRPAFTERFDLRPIRLEGQGLRSCRCCQARSPPDEIGWCAPGPAIRIGPVRLRQHSSGSSFLAPPATSRRASSAPSVDAQAPGSSPRTPTSTFAATRAFMLSVKLFCRPLQGFRLPCTGCCGALPSLQTRLPVLLRVSAGQAASPDPTLSAAADMQDRKSVVVNTLFRKRQDAFQRPAQAPGMHPNVTGCGMSGALMAGPNTPFPLAKNGRSLQHRTKRPQESVVQRNPCHRPWLFRCPRG